MRKNVDNKSAYLMLIPTIVLLITFVYIPLSMALFRSFFESTPEGTQFLGFQTFIQTITNEYFMKSIWTVLKLSITITLTQLVISFLFANALVKVNKKLSVISRTLIYLPNLISGIVVAVIFTLLTTFNGGIINSLLESIGGSPIAFNNDYFWSPLSIIIPTIWIGFGYFSLVMYAGIINIPKTYFEAAEVDGASFLQKMFYITIPMMKNYFILLVVTMIVVNLQMFEIPMIMTNGQPANTTLTPVLYLIHSRSNGNISDTEITTAAILIMIIIIIINSSIFYLFKNKKGRKWEM
ncbi:MAG: sugar ABC transporter permease [Tenericutes bacterium]|nr:sugar ABC transporter permease [Mycoplasmatota bacterium]